MEQIVSFIAAGVFGAIALWSIVLIHHPRVDDGIIPKIGLMLVVIGCGSLAMRFADPFLMSTKGVENSVICAIVGAVLAVVAQLRRRRRS